MKTLILFSLIVFFGVAALVEFASTGIDRPTEIVLSKDQSRLPPYGEGE